MKISLITLFPEMFQGPFDHSIIKRAKEKGLVDIEFINIRNFGIGTHKMVDDTVYGGGVGMVMRVDVAHQAIEHAKKTHTGKTRIIHLTAKGKPFKQEMAKEYSQLDHLILLCGHYEGIDERIRYFIDEEVSIGDFVLTGGEIPAMLITDSVTRLLPGVLPVGAADDESFATYPSSNFQQLLEYPHFTKPQSYEGHDVPKVLLSGNHKRIKEWREDQSINKTKNIRPDLLNKRY